MIEDVLKLLKGEQDLTLHIQQMSNQIASLERENELRLERYQRLKSKIDRLNAVKSLFLYIQDPSIDESSSSYSNDFLEMMIKANHS
tara:strand:- start:196 stop:456 length:261 start_codon:yes stop_codon:yes gene_type:complete